MPVSALNYRHLHDVYNEDVYIQQLFEEDKIKQQTNEVFELKLLIIIIPGDLKLSVCIPTSISYDTKANFLGLLQDLLNALL